MKIQICGYSGSGKSTFGERLSKFYDIDILYLDTVKFKENWQENSYDFVIEVVNEFMKNPNWIIDGNYFSVVQNRYQECDQIFFFNFNRFKCFYGALKRYFTYKNRSRPSITQGCNERINFSFAMWVLFTGRRKKRRNYYKSLIKNYPNKIVIFKNRKQVNQYLLKIGYNGSLKYS